MKLKVQIFLSYAPPDMKEVESYYQKLLKAGYKPWMDKKDIVKGAIQQSGIERAILESDIFLVFLSKNSISRQGGLKKEIKEALDNWKEKSENDSNLISAKLEECKIPEQLRGFESIELFKKDGWARLMNSVQSRIKKLSPIAIVPDIDEPANKVKLLIRVDLEQDKEKYKQLLRLALASFLKISPDDVRITITERGENEY